MKVYYFCNVECVDIISRFYIVPSKAPRYLSFALQGYNPGIASICVALTS